MRTLNATYKCGQRERNGPIGLFTQGAVNVGHGTGGRQGPATANVGAVPTTEPRSLAEPRAVEVVEDAHPTLWSLHWRNGVQRAQSGFLRIPPTNQPRDPLERERSIFTKHRRGQGPAGFFVLGTGWISFDAVPSHIS
jgi:hypothetical protein